MRQKLPVPYCLILNSNPVFLFLLSTFFIIKFTTFSLPTIINNFFALVIPVYNKFLVSSIGAACGKAIITTSNSLPLCFMYCYCITMFYLIQFRIFIPGYFIIIKSNFNLFFFFIYIYYCSYFSIKNSASYFFFSYSV